MNAFWKKHQVKLKWASRLLPVLVTVWAVAIEHPPLAALGAALAGLALWVLNRQGHLASFYRTQSADK